MIRKIVLPVAAVCVLNAAGQPASATAPLNACNTSGECRAELASVYTAGNYAYVVLRGHLLPAVCTSAPWSYYWTVPLTTDADRSRYAMLLSAYLAHEVVELRALDAACTVMATNVGD